MEAASQQFRFTDYQELYRVHNTVTVKSGASHALQLVTKPTQFLNVGLTVVNVIRPANTHTAS